MTVTMNAPSANGKRRPSLGEQVNRLDNMLDGLSEALNEAVADAVKAGVGSAVKEAVQAVLKEVLTNPEIRARLAPPPPPPVPDPPRSSGLWGRVRTGFGYLRNTCANLLHAAAGAVTHARKRVQEKCAFVWSALRIFWPFKFQILFAMTVGAAVGMAEPWMAAIITGIGGFVTTLAVQASLWLRSLLAGEDRRFA
jgi:hypothetical protein